jgi:Ca-activated chloride channel homolog
MTFYSPWALVLLPVALLFVARIRRRLMPSESKQSVPFLLPFPVDEIRTLAARTSWKLRVGERWSTGLKIVSWSCLVVALARPQLVQTIDEIEMSGRDIFLTLDLSGSMQAMDFELNDKRVDRLTALKHVVEKFLSSRPGDRIGLIVFGDKVFIQCPLTVDHSAVIRFVNALEIGMGGSGTAVGDALVVSLKRIQNIPEHSKVIILVTDGKSNSGAVQPKEAVELASKLGVKVHVVGIGGTEPAPFPAKDFFGVTRLVNRPMEYDEETLKLIAQNTGGIYFNAKDTSQLTSVYSEIDKLETRSVKSYQNRQVDEYFWLPLGLGALSLVAAFILGHTLLRRVV